MKAVLSYDVDKFPAFTIYVSYCRWFGVEHIVAIYESEDNRLTLNADGANKLSAILKAIHRCRKYYEHLKLQRNFPMHVAYWDEG